MLLLIAIFWLACSFLSYGFAFGYFQNEYPLLAKGEYYGDIGFSIVVSIFGPLSLLITYSQTERFKHPFKVK